MNREVTVTIPDHIMPILTEAAEKRNLSLTDFVELILNEWALSKLMIELMDRRRKASEPQHEAKCSDCKEGESKS